MACTQIVSRITFIFNLQYLISSRFTLTIIFSVSVSVLSILSDLIRYLFDLLVPYCWLILSSDFIVCTEKSLYRVWPWAVWMCFLVFHCSLWCYEFFQNWSMWTSGFWFGWVWFFGISTFVGNLMSNHVYTYMYNSNNKRHVWNGHSIPMWNIHIYITSNIGISKHEKHLRLLSSGAKLFINFEFKGSST